MRNMLLLCIMLALVLSLGCGKEEETAQTEKTESIQQEKPKVVARTPLPERHEKLTSEETPYTYVYKKRLYFFKTEENLKIFKENPEKYIAELK
jgi:YHS domain-containing protein